MSVSTPRPSEVVPRTYDTSQYIITRTRWIIIQTRNSTAANTFGSMNLVRRIRNRTKSVGLSELTISQ